MRVFVAVAENGGLAKAGRLLGMSPPAVTRSIAALEARLGVPLLHRSTRSVTLTDEGAALLERARDALSGLEAAERTVAAMRDEPHGDLRVTAPSMFGRLHVLPALGELLRRHPGLKARLVLADRNLPIVESGIDVAVRIGALRDSQLRAARIGQTRQCLIASPAYLASRPTPSHPDGLAAHDLIGVEGPRTGTHWRFGPDPRGIVVAPRLVVSSPDAALAAACAGLGIANLLAYQTADARAAGVLVEVLADAVPPPLPIHLVFHPSRASLAAIREFVDTMRLRGGAALRAG